jgi:hypothetical protein
MLSAKAPLLSRLRSTHAKQSPHRTLTNSLVHLDMARTKTSSRAVQRCMQSIVQRKVTDFFQQANHALTPLQVKFSCQLLE